MTHKDVNHGYRRSAKEHWNVVGVVKLGEKIYRHARLFVKLLWRIPDVTSLSFDYVTLHGLFVNPNVHIMSNHVRTVLNSCRLNPCL